MRRLLATSALGMIALSFGLSSTSVPSIVLAQTLVRFEVGLHGMPQIPENRYFVVTDDPGLIDLCRQQLALPEAQRTLHVNGALAATHGGFNPPWSWHIVPNDWSLVSVSIELCDGTPKMVEQDLATWLDDIGRFCAWDSFIRREMATAPVERAGWGMVKARFR